MQLQQFTRIQKYLACLCMKYFLLWKLLRNRRIENNGLHLKCVLFLNVSIDEKDQNVVSEL